MLRRTRFDDRLLVDLLLKDDPLMALPNSASSKNSSSFWQHYMFMIQTAQQQIIRRRKIPTHEAVI
tara:strand:+ start:455 stop:652 length:198 start_codon:yes stop_codon:yes gene_type:complete